MSSRAHERRSREIRARSARERAARFFSSRFFCPRPPLLLSNQNRHATQAIQASLGSSSSVVNQLAVCNLSKFSPSLPLSLYRWVGYIALPSLKLGRSYVVWLSLRSDFLQACWLVAFVHCSLANILVRSSTSCLPLSS